MTHHGNTMSETDPLELGSVNRVVRVACPPCAESCRRCELPRADLLAALA